MATTAKRNSRGEKSMELESPVNSGGGGTGRTVIWKTELGAAENC